MDWGFSLADVANGIFVIVLAIVGAIGAKRGLSSKPKQEVAEIAGGIVDNSAINRLTAAIEARAMEDIKNRKLGHEMVEAIQDLTKELSEVRGEMRLKRR